MLIDFQNSLISGLTSKRAVKWSLKVPPHLKLVTTLLCET